MSKEKSIKEKSSFSSSETRYELKCIQADCPVMSEAEVRVYEKIASSQNITARKVDVGIAKDKL